MLLAGLFLVVGALAHVARAHSLVDLSKGDWSVQNANGSIRLAAQVPGYALTDLQAAGIIGNELYRFNERAYRWVAHDTWTYRVTFDLPASVRGAKHKDLILHGVDTFATVYLNGQMLAELDSYHRVYTLSVDGLLKAKGNKLKIAIKPALDETVARRASHPYTINTLAAFGAYDTYNYARKPAYDFGWDWGPTFAASGIHGKVEVMGYSEPVLRGVHVHQHKRGAKFVLDTEAEFRVPQAGGSGLMTAEIAALNIKKQVRVSFLTAKVTQRGFAKLSLEVPAKAVKLWWPVGYGGQPLYDLKVKFVPGTAGCVAASTASRRLAGLTDPVDVPEAEATAAAAAAIAAASSGKAAAAAQATPAAKSAAKPASAVNTAKAAAKPPSKQKQPTCGPSSSIARRIGFRVIEVVQDPLPKAAEDLLHGEPGWVNTQIKPLKGWNEGQWALVNGTQWLFIANPPNVRNPDYHSGYDWPSPPGGEDTWWWYGQPDNLTDNPFKAQWVTGESFYFRVNGIPIYAKGANIIPFDILRTRASVPLMKRVLQNALDSNMNMLRIWGGGQYPDEFVYDWADEHGVMLWQESMFACSYYPRDNAFVESVHIETEQAVRRYSSHASLAIWGGNNEIETSMEWYKNTRQNQAMYAVDFAKLFIDTIGGALAKLNPTLTYLDSSPTNGVVSKDPWVKRWGWAQDPRYGDVHFYDYAADCQDFRSFPNAKFVSEYGWQAYPSWYTWSSATEAKDQVVGGDMFEWRNRHPNGTYEMVNQMGYHFNTIRDPAAWATGDSERDAANLRSFLYFSQVQQMLCYDTSVGYWRRSRSEPSSLTMGVLYWQLNDVWVGPTWSGIDHLHRWKPLQYAIKKQFAPIVVQAAVDNGYLKVWAVSDLLTPVKSTLSIRLRSTVDDMGSCTAASVKAAKAAAAQQEGAAAVSAARTAPQAAVPAGAAEQKLAGRRPEKAGGDHVVLIPALGAAEVYTESIDTLQEGCQQGTCYAEIALVARDGSGAAHTSEAVVFFQQLKDMTLQKPNVQLSDFVQVDDTSVRFTVSVDAPAPHTVWESSVVGRFTHNGLTLHPCRPRTITFSTYGEPVTTAQLKASMMVDTLWQHSQRQ